jgi:TetR/AcrR family transcriptional regulator, cholesterol catabolism regulator
MPTGLTERRAETRARIIEGAGRVFRRDGFRQLTMDQVCAEIGIAKKTLYQYFRTRDELVDAVVDAHLAVLAEGIDQVVADTKRDPYDALRALQEHLAQHLGDLTSAALARDLRVSRPELWDRLQNERRKLLARLEDVHEQGKRRGVFRRDVNSRIAVLMLQAVVAELLRPETLIENGLAMEDTRRGIFDVLVHGILATPTTAARRK